MRVLVCGGRTWGYAWYGASVEEKRRALAQRRQTFTVLDKLDRIVGIDVLIHGDAKGADTTAQKWAETRGCPVERFPANWHEYGRKAGPIRNTQMLDEGLPDLVVAFPGGVGTSDMVGKAIDRNGVEVLDVREVNP